MALRHMTESLTIEPYPDALSVVFTAKGVIRMLHSFFTTEEGQGLVEYALILVLIAIVVIGILTLLGGKVSDVFSTINSGLK
jgi:pilus assembly protein Flp/PilA